MGTLLSFTGQTLLHPCSTNRCTQSSALEIKCRFCVVSQESECYRTRITVCSCVLRADGLAQGLVPAVTPSQRQGQLAFDLPHAVHQWGYGGPRWGGCRGCHCSTALSETHKCRSRTLHAASWFIWYPLCTGHSKVMHFQGRRPLKDCNGMC